MDPRFINALTGLVATAGTFLAIAIVLSGWARSRGKKQVTGGESAALEARVSQLETELGALSVELERLGEHQRYVTKLLEERSAAAPRGSLTS